ncbi:hypothetical protein PG988_011819 [Apiospora saccharicola]
MMPTSIPTFLPTPSFFPRFRPSLRSPPRSRRPLPLDAAALYDVGNSYAYAAHIDDTHALLEALSHDALPHDALPKLLALPTSRSAFWLSDPRPSTTPPSDALPVYDRLGELDRRGPLKSNLPPLRGVA